MTDDGHALVDGLFQLSPEPSHFVAFIASVEFFRLYSLALGFGTLPARFLFPLYALFLYHPLFRLRRQQTWRVIFQTFHSSSRTTLEILRLGHFRHQMFSTGFTQDLEVAILSLRSQDSGCCYRFITYSLDG